MSSSTTNLALYVGILLSTDTARFGRWVAVLGVYHLVLALSRSLVSEPMVANDRPTSTGQDFSWAWARRRHGLLGAGAALGVGGVGWLVDADRFAVVAVVAAVPLLIGQDGVRNLAWSRRRADLAVGLDLIWLLVTGALLSGLVAGGEARPVPIILSWLAGGVVSSLVAGALAPRLLDDADADADADAETSTETEAVGPRRRSGRVSDQQLHRRRQSHAVLVTARNLLPIAVAALAGPVSAGLLKAGLLPFTPILTLFAGLRLVALPALQRAAEAGPSAAVGRAPLEGVVARLIGCYAAVATVGAFLTVLIAEALLEALAASGSVDSAIRPELLRWGAVVAVTTVIVRPLAEAVAFGPGSAPVRRLRLLEMAAEWAGVFGAIVLAGPDQVMVGWAVGMAAGGLVWVLAGLGLAQGRR